VGVFFLEKMLPLAEVDTVQIGKFITEFLRLSGRNDEPG
jgi:hypothetical protein